MNSKLTPEQALRLILQISSSNTYRNYRRAVHEIAQPWNDPPSQAMEGAEVRAWKTTRPRKIE
jgi:hypothetical protein